MTMVKRGPNAEWRPVHSANWGDWNRKFTFSDWIKPIFRGLNSGPKRKVIDILVLHGSRWQDTVKLVTVFTPVWIAYDRYGLWGCSEKEVSKPVTS